MAASRTISIRLGVDGSQEIKSALEGLRADVDATSQRVKASLEGLSSGDVGGKLANQLTAAATRIAALQKALGDASASGNTEAQVAIQTRLTAAMQGYAAVLDRAAASVSPLAAAEQTRTKALFDATNAVKAAAIAEDEGAAARLRAQGTYDKQIKAIQDYAAAAQAAKAIVISSPGFSFAQDRGADIAAYGAELDRLRAKFNPLFAVSKQYEGLLSEISDAERVGAISASEAAQAREAATAAFAKSNAPIIASTAALKDYAAAADAAKSLIVSSPGFSPAQDRGANIAAYGAELDKLRAKYDPLFAASKQYESLLEGISDAERVGAISANVAAKARENATIAFAQSNGPIIASTAALKDYAAAANAAKSLVISSPDFSPARDRGADIAAYGAELDKLRAKYNPLFAAERQYRTELEAVSQALKVGAINEAEAKSARATLASDFEKASTAATKTANSTDNLSGSTRNANTQLRLLGVQAIQTASGLATGQPILTTFIQQFHQVLDSLLATGTGFGVLKGAFSAAVSAIGPMNIALVAGAAAIYELGAAAEHESTRMGDLRQQLRATHEDYASLADSVDEASKAVAASTSLSTANARTATQAIASARLFSGTQQDLVELTKTSQALARVWNTDVATSAKFLAEALNDPAKAANDLAQRGFPGMSLELAHTITLLQAAGQSGQAFSQVMSVLHSGTVGATQDESALSKALHDLGQTFTTAKDGGKSLSQNLGELIDGFAALQVRGLNNIIQGLDTYIRKMQEATRAGNVGNLATRPGGGGVDENGRPYNPGAIGSGVTSSPASASGALAQVDASIRPLVEAAAKQYQVDVELLARLQRTENVKPLGNDLSGQPVFATSSAGAIGPMQIKPDTFSGMLNLPYGREFRGQALGNVQTNINAGGSFFAYLLDRYKDPYMAVLAWHDGETRIDNMLNGVINPQTHSTYQASGAAREQAEEVKAGYTGPGLTGPYRYGNPPPALTAAGYDIISSPNGNLSAAVRANDLATSQNAFNLAQGVNPLSAQIEKAKADIAGLQAGLDLATKAGDTDKIKLLTDSLAKARGEMTNLITEQQKMARSAQDAAAPLNAEAGATRDLAVIQQKYVEAARSAGTAIDTTSMLAEQTAKLRTLAVAFDDTVKATDRQTAANQRIVASVDQSAPSLIAATNREKALAQAREDFLPGPEKAAQVDRYTAALNRESASVADLATKQKSFDQRNELQLIQAETASLGENQNQRDKEIALLKEKQALIARGADLQSAASQADLRNIAAIQDATAAYKQQETALNELKGFFDNTFSTISTAITQAFATGNLQALKFKDIMHSVASAVISEFAKLAVLNPLKNMLFGESSSNPTLASVGGIIGKLFGGSGAGGGIDSGGVSTLLGLAGGAASLFGGNSSPSPAGVGFNSSVGQNSLAQGLNLVSTLTGATGVTNTANGKSADIGGSGGGFSVLSAAGLGSTLLGLGEKLGITGAGGIVSKLTDTVKAISNYSLYSSGAVGEAAGTAGATVQALDGINVTLGSAVGAIGGIYSAIQGFQRGGVGGAVQGVAGIAGAGLAVAGTGLLGAGAAGLAAAAGPYAPIALAAIAIIGALLPGGHPLHPFDATAVDAQDGKLAVGKTATQAMQATSLSTVTSFVQGVNEFMSQAHLILENGNGQLGAIGQGIAGMVGLVTDPNKILETLRFKNDPTDTSQFGVAKGALEGMSFPNAQALTDELIKIASFADATAALGLKLDSVGRDITNIHVGSVEGINPNQTATVTDANGQSVQYLNDLRTALTNDLPKQTWANVEALDAEINTVNQFVNGTLPGLLHPIEQTTSSIVDAVAKVDATYQQAIAQSESYGLDNARVLNDAEQQAIAIIRRAGIEQISASETQIVDRLRIAQGGGPKAAADQALDNFDLQAVQQRNALSKQLTDTYGDTIKSTEGYLRVMNELEATLGAERVAAAKQAAMALEAVYRGVADTEDNVTARFYQVTGRGLEGALLAQDVKARNETTAFVKTWTDAFGDAITQGADFQERLAQLQTVQASEKQAIVTQYATQPDPTQAKLTTLADTVQSIIARSYAASGDQKDADLIDFDIKARQERAAFEASFIDLYGPAITANDNYQAQLTGLETVQGQERLAIVKKYGDAVNGATADQIKSAQGSVASLFTSLGDYVTKLQGGSNSPLSPTAQYDFAKNQFNAVAGAAAAGDATSAGKLTGFADTLLSASRAVNGSGVGYATDFNRVIDAIQSVVQAPADALTNSFLALQLQQQTASITQAQQATTDAVNALRREIMQQSRLQATAA